MRTTAVIIVAAVAGALAACATPTGEIASTGAEEPPPPGAPVPAGGPLPAAAAIASMALQYSQPVLGPTPAAGASAWVRPSPPPAFTISAPLPPDDLPAPSPAAVANRQPGPPSAASPAEIARPEAAVPEASVPASTVDVDLVAGRRLFADYSCGACHILADAGGAGGVGPSLDRNPRLSRDYAIDVIANGSGAMPAFAGQLSNAEIATLADYLVWASRD